MDSLENTTEYTAIDDDSSEPVQHKALKYFVSWIVPSLYSLVFIFGLLGNMLVMLILIRYKKFKNMTDTYLFNLAISDLLFIFALPFWAYEAANKFWIFGDALCKMLSAIYFAGFYSGSFFIVLLTIDRYLATVHAVFALKARTVFYGILLSVITWVVALLISVPQLIIYHVQERRGNYICSLSYPEGQEKQWKQALHLMMFILGLATPCVLMVFCYSQIIIILKKSKNERKQKAVRLIFVIMTVYFILWIPYNITSLLQAYQHSFCESDCEEKLALAVEVSRVVAIIHCCLNPVIYAFMGEQFRKYLLIFFQKDIQPYLCRICRCVNLSRIPSRYGSTTEREISTGM